MRERALEVVSIPARMNVLDPCEMQIQQEELVSTYEVCERISSSVICSEGVAAMFALTVHRDQMKR